MVLEPLKGVLMSKSYKLTARGEAVLGFAEGILIVAVGFATLHILARVIIWIGELLGVA
jgi:hypothetical protein